MKQILSKSLECLVGLRNSMYDSGVLKSEKMPVPIISVGNITMGGTGKTPFVLWLLEHFRCQSIKAAVVVKSYKAGLKEPRRVTTGYNEARHYGDEAVLIALKYPDFPVWAGPNKTETCKALLASEKDIQVVIIDDGFQHRRLKRDLDIVLLDSSVSPQDYQYPPMGRARETLKQAQRADAFVLTKIENQNAQTMQYLTEDLAQVPNALVFKTHQVAARPKYFSGLKQDWDSEQGVLGFCGIGNPQGFEKALRKYGVKLEEFRAFADHQFYEPQLIKELEAAAQGKFAITTEKDTVKLQDWSFSAPPLFALPIKIKFEGDMEALNEKINQLFR